MYNKEGFRGFGVRRMRVWSLWKWFPLNYRFYPKCLSVAKGLVSHICPFLHVFCWLLSPSSKPSLKDPDRLMVRVFSSSDMQEFLSRLSLEGSKGTSWFVRLLLRRPVRLIWAVEVGLDAEKKQEDISVSLFLFYLNLKCQKAFIVSYKISLSTNFRLIIKKHLTT